MLLLNLKDLLPLEQENKQNTGSNSATYCSIERWFVGIEDNQLILRNGNILEEFIVLIGQILCVHGTVVADDLDLVVQAFRNSECDLAIILFQILQQFLSRTCK